MTRLNTQMKKTLLVKVYRIVEEASRIDVSLDGDLPGMIEDTEVQAWLKQVGAALKATGGHRHA